MTPAFPAAVLGLCLGITACLRSVGEPGCVQHPPCAEVQGFTGRASAEAYDDAGVFLGWTLADARCPPGYFCYQLGGASAEPVCLKQCPAFDGGGWVGASPCESPEQCEDLWDPVLQGPVEPGGGCACPGDAVTPAAGPADGG